MVAPDDLVRPGASVSIGLGLGVSESEVPDLATSDVKETPVNLKAAVADRLLDGEVGHEHLDARLDVELGDAHRALPVVADGRQLVGVGVAHRLERRQPRVEHAAHPRVGERRRRAAARRVPAQHHVLDLEVRHGVLDHRRSVDVGRRDDVGDVAVDEDVARLQAEDRRLGAAGVGATEPDCVVCVISQLSFFETLGGPNTISRRHESLNEPHPKFVVQGAMRHLRIWGDWPLASFGKNCGFWYAL